MDKYVGFFLGIMVGWCLYNPMDKHVIFGSIVLGGVIACLTIGLIMKFKKWADSL